ncbi:MAG TPA: hypothetical protein VFH74_13525 [Gaiellales bacterium]|nr:hypothetical protein [Gaiellales bacterium]
MRRTLIAALVFFLTSAGVAHAEVVTGRVDSTGEHARIRVATVFHIASPQDITATLRWRSATANLRLGLARRQPDGSWRRVARSFSPTAHPKHLSLADAPRGVYRLRVRAVTGRTRFRLRFTGTPVEPPPASGAFVTLLFSRTEIGTATRCVPDSAGYANLLTVVAPALAVRGIAATGSVETGITRDTTRACVHYRRSLAASWADLRALQSQFHWAFVSHGRTWATNLTAMSPQQQWNDVCGSLVDLERHGFWSGDGLFAFPNNSWSTAVQTDVVSKCFAFGRRYGTGPTDRSSAMEPPYWQRTEGISGGRCHDTSLPCSRMHTLTTYRSPEQVRSQLLALGANQWLTLQSYVLVTGDREGAWHCTGSDWRQHWTNDPERYCWSDYRTIVDSIPTSVRVTDPKTVARAWGRTAYQAPAP